MPSVVYYSIEKLYILVHKYLSFIEQDNQIKAQEAKIIMKES